MASLDEASGSGLGENKKSGDRWAKQRGEAPLHTTSNGGVFILDCHPESWTYADAVFSDNFCRDNRGDRGRLDEGALVSISSSLIVPLVLIAAATSQFLHLGLNARVKNRLGRAGRAWSCIHPHGGTLNRQTFAASHGYLVCAKSLF